MQKLTFTSPKVLFDFIYRIETTLRRSHVFLSDFLQAVSSLTCAQKGWMNVDVDKIECESCGAYLSFVFLPSWAPAEG